MTRLKALPVLQAREHVRTKYGEQTVELIRSGLAREAHRELYEAPLVASDWIEVATAVEYLMTFDRVVGSGDGSAATNLVRRSAADHFKGLYRVLFAITSPRTVLEKGARIWTRFYDRGESIAEVDPERNHARMTIRGCPDMPKHHELLLLPYGDELLTRTGAQDVKSRHLQCVADGAPVCVTETTWK